VLRREKKGRRRRKGENNKYKIKGNQAIGKEERWTQIKKTNKETVRKEGGMTPATTGVELLQNERRDRKKER